MPVAECFTRARACASFVAAVLAGHVVLARRVGTGIASPAGCERSVEALIARAASLNRASKKALVRARRCARPRKTARAILHNRVVVRATWVKAVAAPGARTRARGRPACLIRVTTRARAAARSGAASGAGPAARSGAASGAGPAARSGAAAAAPSRAATGARATDGSRAASRAGPAARSGTAAGAAAGAGARAAAARRARLAAARPLRAAAAGVDPRRARVVRRCAQVRLPRDGPEVRAAVSASHGVQCHGEHDERQARKSAAIAHDGSLLRRPRWYRGQGALASR
jgi:hypothetical protein